ncbi:MAG: SgcJ/EcaC family oxidoreductase [Kofleriaceae bacterium]
MMVEDLYTAFIAAWNKRDAEALAELFMLDGDVVGFDGSQYTGRGSILEEMKKIFAAHPTAPYTGKQTGVTTVTTDVAIVRAIAGMIPPGETAFEPKLHAIHRLTAVFRGGDWRIALLHTTPAQYHDRPDEVAKHTAALEAAAAS